MQSIRFTLIVATIGLLFTLAVPTAALTVGENPASDDVLIEPADSRYATVEDGEIGLDLERLNDRAITRADDVFTITVTDDAIKRIWISQDVSDLWFYAGDDPTTPISESRPLEPSAGDTIRIGVAVDTHDIQDRDGNFTVTVEYEDGDEDRPANPDGSSASPAIDTSNLTVLPTTLETGQTVTANATYRNVGDAPGETTASLTVDGTIVDQQTLELEPGETKPVSFERRMEWPGTYDVGIEGVGSESVTVDGPPVDVVDATVDDSAITAGDSTGIQATVRNPTDTRVERTLELAIDGIVVESRVVSIPANSERTVSFDRRFDGAGTYEISVSGVTAGTVTVDEPALLEIRNRELSAATTAALAPPATAGLLFLVVVANRRWAFVR